MKFLEAHARHDQRASKSKRRLSSIAACWRPFIVAWPKNGASRSAGATAWPTGRSVKNWPAFANSADALQYLKRRYKLVILSNVDNESFSASNEKLKIEFDAVYTAEDCGSYKPWIRNFEYMLAKLETLGIHKHDILHTAESLFHDHAPANKHGLASLLDLSPARSRGLRRDHDPGANAEIRLSLRQSGRSGHSASGGADGLRRAQSTTASASISTS